MKKADNQINPSLKKEEGKGPMSDKEMKDYLYRSAAQWFREEWGIVLDF